MVDSRNVQTLMEGELDLERKGSFATPLSKNKTVLAKLQPNVLMFKERPEKKWNIVDIRNVTGLQLEKEDMFALEMMGSDSKRTLMRFRSRDAKKWIAGLRRATALTSANTKDEKIVMGEYEVVALQEDLKNAKTGNEWCERFQHFMSSKYRRHLRLEPVLDSALIEGKNFVEHVKDCVRSPHWFVRIDQNKNEKNSKEILVQDLPLGSSSITNTSDSPSIVVVGKPPETATGSKASNYFNSVVSALKELMRCHKISTVKFTHDEVAKWIMGVKRIDRNGDLIMGFLSSLSGGFTNRRFVSQEKKGSVLVSLNSVDEVAIVHLRNQEYSLQNMSSESFGEVRFESNLIVKLNFRTQVESTELRLHVGVSKSSKTPVQFSFSCFYPTRKQIADVYRKTFKIQGRDLFTNVELVRLSDMSVSESFNPNGLRIVTQGVLLRDLYVLCVCVCVGGWVWMSRVFFCSHSISLFL